MTSRRLVFTCAVLSLGVGLNASAAQRDRADLANEAASLAEVAGLPVDQNLVGNADYAAAEPVELLPGLNIHPAMIPATGLTIPAEGFRGESHNQPLQDCAVSTEFATFNTAHGPFTRGNCTGGGPGDCLEDFNLVGPAAGISVCPPNNEFNCLTNNICAAPGAILSGLSTRETELVRGAPIVQNGTLAAGPGWFGNRGDLSGKFILNNFFNDSWVLRFVGDPLFPAGCAASHAPPTAVGFDIHNHLNSFDRENIITATLANGNRFVWKALGRQSGGFTGICCVSPVRNVVFQSLADMTEGVDNVIYGSAGTCTRPKVDVTTNQLSDAMEALEVKIDNFQCTGGGGGTTPGN